MTVTLILTDGTVELQGCVWVTDVYIRNGELFVCADDDDLVYGCSLTEIHELIVTND